MNTPRTTSRRVLVAAIAFGAFTSAAAATAGSAHAYPPQPPTGGQSIEVTTLDPGCEIDVPHVFFAVEPVGFESSGPTLATVRDLDGNIVKTVESEGLSGSFVYPGASAGTDGRATDWPGWELVGGNWVQDSSDARLRDGLNVTFQVGSASVSETVGYPGVASGCAGPAAVSSIGGSTTTQASLPATGNSAMSTTMLAGALALLLGLALTSWNAVSNRRRSAADASLG